MNNMTFLILFSALISFSTSTLAKNIYSYPDLSKSSGKFDSFMIDFQGVKTQSSTFWALCNWQMDLTEFKKSHEKVTGGGGQGGFQKTENGQSAVLSIWDLFYHENGKQKTLKAKLMYPEGASRSFKGQGTGRNIISEFCWESDKWYRLVIKSWKDIETGNTFIGEWVKDIEAGRWQLISYFDTNLKDSFIIGALSQFQENHDEKNFGSENSFKIKNIYAHDIQKKIWISINTATFYYDLAYSGLNTVGTHKFVAEEDYFYASSGLKVENQTEYDEKNLNHVKNKIKQADRPTIEDILIQAKASIDKKKTINISWSVNLKKTPVYSYQIKIAEVLSPLEKRTIHTYVTTRPEQNTYSFQYDFEGKYVVYVEATGIMGQVATHSTTVIVK